VLGLWFGIALAGGVAAALGYTLLGDASDTVLGVVQSFAAGTILTMLASVMMPTAYNDGKQAVGLAFVLGFALLSYLTTLGA
jgi:ZIP family zinc transporter